MEGKFILRSSFRHAGKVLTVIVKNYNGQGALQLTASHTVPLQAFELCNLCYVTHTDLPSSELLSSGFESFQNTLSPRRLCFKKVDDFSFEKLSKTWAIYNQLDCTRKSGNDHKIKRYCFLARKNVRSEAIENSMKERHVLPTPIVKRDPIIQSNPATSIQHRRISIFNRLTNQMQQSVIKLNPSKPVPTRVRRLNFTTDELSPGKDFLILIAEEIQPKKNSYENHFFSKNGSDAYV